MNMFKKNGGFTLVELIVVIAILAILAAVAVPAYTGYIAKAEEAADLQVLSSVNTAVQGLAAGQGATVEEITVEKNADDEWEVTATAMKETTGDTTISNDEITNLTGELNFGAKFEGATWASNEWTMTEETPETT